MFKYCLNCVGYNQTIHISQPMQIILNLDRSLKVYELTSTDFISYIKTVNYSLIHEGFSNCKNIKLPNNMTQMAELKFGTIFSLEMPNKIIKGNFSEKSSKKRFLYLYIIFFVKKEFNIYLRIF